MKETGKTKKRKRIRKGKQGYILSERKRSILITAGLFVIPLSLFIGGWIYCGTRENILTVLAVVGCLPACKSMVSVIMFLMQKPMDPALYQQAEKARGNLVGGYELTLTAYEKTVPVNAFIVCGTELVCYTPDEKADTSFMEKHISKIMAGNHISDLHVKVMKDFKQYLQRTEMIRNRQQQYREGIEWTPDDRYPDLSRDEFIYHTMLAISL